MTKVVEPILQENPNRFVLFPIEHDDIWAWYKKSEETPTLKIHKKRTNFSTLSKH